MVQWFHRAEFKTKPTNVQYIGGNFHKDFNTIPLNLESGHTPDSYIVLVLSFDILK